MAAPASLPPPAHRASGGQVSKRARPPPAPQELAPRHAFAVLRLPPAPAPARRSPAAAPTSAFQASWPDWRGLSLLLKSDVLFCKQLEAASRAAPAPGPGPAAPLTVDEYRAFKTRFQKGGMQARPRPPPPHAIQSR